VKYPKCGREGLLAEKPTVTKIGNKTYTYRKLYVPHYLQNSISKKSGKLVNRVQWCYLNKVDVEKLRKMGVVEDCEDVTQNVTQNNDGLCVTPNNRDLGSDRQNIVKQWWSWGNSPL
jgi:hypothetical protein